MKLWGDYHGGCWGPLSWFLTPSWTGWVSLFGYGLHVKHRSERAYFTERNGFNRFWPHYSKSPRWRFGLFGPAA